MILGIEPGWCYGRLGWSDIGGVRTTCIFESRCDVTRNETAQTQDLLPLESDIMRLNVMCIESVICI
jgi:hypothetical protein